ncbi:MAG: double-strand break repair protein AddB [Pseudomonadota bacterium]
MAFRSPRIFSISPGVPFLETLARVVLEQGFPRSAPPSQAELTGYTILVPTRRAARELADAFLRISGGEALLLPQIRPLGDVDEEELALFAGPGAAPCELELPPAISPMRRQLLLARMLLDWARSNPDAPFARALLPGPVEAVQVARGLGRLLDQLETEEVSAAGFEQLVAEEFALYWQDVLQVLSLIRKDLPATLTELGVIGFAQRRGLLLRAEAARLETLQPGAPVIAAGSTGSIPATAKLLNVISRLPNGAVVLPGLDMHLDEDSWRALDPQHPQFGLAELLQGFEAGREHVEPLSRPPSTTLARQKLLSEVMRPSETTELWRERLDRMAPDVSGALEGLSLIRAPVRREEALAIALILREAVEVPGRTAALVTPDRTLGRQVSAQLKTWGLTVDDSAGVPLSRTVPGTFINLVLNVMKSGFDPASLAALFAHPLARFGMAPGDAARAARKLELAVWRGVPMSADLADVRAAIETKRMEVAGRPHWHPHLARWTEDDWIRAGAAANAVAPAFEPFLAALEGETPMRLDVAAETLVRVAEHIARDEHGETQALWGGEAGEQLSAFFAGMIEPGEDGPLVAVPDLEAVIMDLMAQPVVRPRYGTHPRLHILGLLEARLTSHDVVILGGLNEGIWPAETETDPWLNRPMRSELGLSAPERRMGLSAHDFVQAAASPGTVYLTCAEKLDGAPAVPSRWLLRLEAALAALGLSGLEERGNRMLRLAAGLHASKTVVPAGRPAPAPALHLRPARMSVTEIETWLRDPYAVFARHVLKLTPLEALNLSPGPRELGILFHQVFEAFARAHKEAMPPDVAGTLRALGQEAFGAWIGHPEVAAFWWPRFERISEAAAGVEAMLRNDLRSLHVEDYGTLTIGGGEGSGFVLAGRADRIDILSDGSARIIDYKTGAPPGITEALSGKSPQLLLEAVMLLRGAFKGVRADRIRELIYLQLSGGEPAIDMKSLDPSGSRPKIDATVEQICWQVFGKLEKLIQRYSTNPGQPYLPRVLPRQENVDLPYDHLSRYREWEDQPSGREGGA